MTDETVPDDGVADDEVTFDPDEDIVTLDPDRIGADELLDIRMESERIDAIALASRIEIERRNAMAYDDYRAQFGMHELMDIGMGLMQAKEDAVLKENPVRINTIETISETFLDILSELDNVDVDPDGDETTVDFTDAGVRQ